MTRTYRLIETRMLSDWLAQNYEGCEKIVRAWLGPMEESTVLARAGVTPAVMMPFAGGWADALILGPDWTRIVESKVVASPAGIGQLEVYSRLFLKTSEYRSRWSMPLIPVLLYAYPRAEVLAYARERGFETVRFCPEYISTYYHEISGALP